MSFESASPMPDDAPVIHISLFSNDISFPVFTVDFVDAVRIVLLAVIVLSAILKEQHQ